MTSSDNPKQKSTLQRLLWVLALTIAFCVVSNFVMEIQYDIQIPRKHHEQVLRTNLSLIRKAIKDFKDDTGVYPADLLDLTITDEYILQAKVKPGTYKGPYLTGTNGIDSTAIPVNPFKDPAGAITVHWNYDAKTELSILRCRQVKHWTAFRIQSCKRQ